MCDQHLRSKMITESAQLLAHAFTLERLAESDCPRTKPGTPWKHGRPYHPCTKWIISSKGNASWLCEHGLAMAVERRKRRPDYNDHHSIPFIRWCFMNIDDMIPQDWELTPFAEAINDESNCRKLPEYERASIHDRYKLFMIHDKPFATWPQDRTPLWILKRGLE